MIETVFVTVRGLDLRISEIDFFPAIEPDPSLPVWLQLGWPAGVYYEKVQIELRVGIGPTQYSENLYDLLSTETKAEITAKLVAYFNSIPKEETS